MPPRLPAYIFVQPTSFGVTQELLKMMPAPTEAATLRPKTVIEAMSGVDGAGRAVILISVSDPKHFKIIETLTGRLGSQLKAGVVKIAALTSLSQPDALKALKKAGCDEVIRADSAAKAIKLKLSRLMSLTERAYQKAAGSGHAVANETGDSAVSSAAGAGKGATPRVKAVAPLKVADDCWIIQGKAFKHVQRMWIVRVSGPSASTGRWIKTSDKGEAWRWAPNDPAGNPFVTQGVWTFYGRQPENKDKAWNFVGYKPRLVYSQEGKDLCARFECGDDKVLRVARNSRAALKKGAAISASYADELKIRKSAPAKAQAPDLGGVALELGEDAAGAAEEATLVGPEAPPFSDGKFGDKTVLEVERLRFYEEIIDELGPRPEMFHAISKRKDCLALIRESASLKAPAIIWTRGQKFRKDTKISHFTKESGRIGIALPAQFDWPKLQSSLQQVQAQEIFVNANLGRTAIFFRQPMSELRGGTGGVEISCPEKIYEVQRRKDLRHRFRAGQDLQVSVILDDGSGEVWKMLDISAGGACIKRLGAPPALGARLKRGSRIQSVSFVVYGREIECSARIAWIKRFKGKGATEDLTIGIQFDHIQRADREGIRLFVLEENYPYLSTTMARIRADESD
jgi:hypothetical protein